MQKKIKYKAKFQDEIKIEIKLIKGDMIGLYERKDSDHITKDQERELLEKRKVDDLEKKLTEKKRNKRDSKKLGRERNISKDM